MSKKPDLKVDIGGLELQNPVMTASGTFGYAREFDRLVDLNRLGGIIVKGLSLNPTKGNPPPRIVETPCGMFNAIGLENVGLEAFVAEKLPFLKGLTPPVIANIYGTLEEEYMQLAARIDAVEAIAAIEVNISCPNVKAGGMVFGVDPTAAFRVVRGVRDQTSKPLIVKLSPNVTDITEIALAAQEAGADSLSLINTLTAMVVDIETRRPRLANITGGVVRTGHKTRGSSNGLAGRPGCQSSRHRHRRDHESGRCPGIFHRRRIGRAGWDCQFYQSPCHHGCH